jgi:DNA-binding CsgD family transcriptional regulator
MQNVDRLGLSRSGRPLGTARRGPADPRPHRSGDVQGGLADLDECGRRLAAAGIVNPAVSTWSSRAVRARLLLCDGEGAVQAATDAVAAARRWGAPVALGRSLRVLASIGPAEPAVALLADAAERCNDQLDALEFARILIDLGIRLMEVGKAEVARPNLRLAVDLASRCGAEDLSEQARLALVAAGARPRRLAQTGPLALTDREREVCELAASGSTNQQIARELFVTQRAVEMHLTRAYRKLGVTGRVDLARALT